MPTVDTLRDHLQGFLGQIKDIPTLPHIYTQLQSLLENPKTSAKDVADTIQSDPGVASKVLKIANSPFYGFPQRITTISHAIVVLGFSSVKNIVLSCSIAELFKSNGEAGLFDYKGFWKHCVATAAFSIVIARKAGVQNPEEAFLAGLMHDLGKVVEFRFFHDEAKRIRELTSQGKTISQAENEVFGFTHSEVTGWLFEKWSLAKLFIEVARCHHNPAVAINSQTLCNVVHVADFVARGMCIGWPGDDCLPKLQKASLEKLKINVDYMNDLIRLGVAELYKSKTFLDAVL